MHEKINEINLIDSLKMTIENFNVTHVGKLRVIQKTEQSGSLRSLEVSGRFALPKIGMPFVLITNALDESLPKERSARLIKTSEIVEVSVLNQSSLRFSTLNSIYQVDEIQEVSNVNYH